MGLSETLFGPDLIACIAQGCDLDSIPLVEELVSKHDNVFASFGIHPKATFRYDDEMEERVLAAFSRCGKKALAWGEFGLDYSHATWGKDPWCQWKQRETFRRQLTLAMERKLPLVIHSREAQADTLEIMNEMVPRDYPLHMHCFMNGLEMMQSMLEGWDKCYFGVASAIAVEGQRDLDLYMFC